MSAEIAFVGYADDCRVQGTVAFDEPRLADFLNRNEIVKLREVTVVSHLDGSSRTLDELEVGRDELLAVVVEGPRGDVERRVRTMAREVVVGLGPYVVRGLVHSVPTADPVRGFHHRPPMVALSNATLTFHRPDGPIEERCEALFVNRDRVASLRLVKPDRPVLPGLEIVPTGGRAVAVAAGE